MSLPSDIIKLIKPLYGTHYSIIYSIYLYLLVSKQNFDNSLLTDFLKEFWLLIFKHNYEIVMVQLACMHACMLVCLFVELAWYEATIQRVPR
jgi:hypothetical protein